MIKVKDSKTGEVWKIHEPYEYSINVKDYVIEIRDRKECHCVYFDSLKKTFEWVATTMDSRGRDEFPKPIS